MEMFELRYFLAVARYENIHRASATIHTSASSLSKAITRLEEELELKLFSREGRHIRLTDSGKILQRRASEILQLEEASKLELLGAKGSIHAVIAGAEILLSESGLEITQAIKKRYPQSVIEFHAAGDEAVGAEVLRGDAHIGLITGDAMPGLKVKVLKEVVFVTCVGIQHPLYELAKANRRIAVETVLEHSFVSPSHPLLGEVGIKQSFDGWRDDKFPRKVQFLASSLTLIEALVGNGQAIAYLPDYYVQKIGARPLKISGCPYACKQTIRMVTRQSKNLGWLNQLF